MNWYRTHILAPQIHSAMNREVICEDRKTAVSGAAGIVLEIGFGSGLNVPYYSTAVTKLYALDPFTELFLKAEPLIAVAPFSVEYLGVSAEKIPLPDNSVDFVVSTWTLCSIPHPEQALTEVERILKPGGVYSFFEHGRRESRFWAALQDIATPFTALCDGNCHLNRNIELLLNGTHLNILSMQKSREPGRPLDYNYAGRAVKRLPS